MAAAPDHPDTYREVVGAFEAFVPARARAKVVPSRAFAKHVRLRLSLPPTLALRSENPGWERMDVHAFHLRPHLAAVLNRRLQTVALRARASSRGLVVSNVGGFHSRRLQVRRHKALRRLATKAAAACAEVEAGGPAPAGGRPRPSSLWANVSEAGDYHGLHDHRDAVWSGVYYVASAGSATQDGGRLVFRTAVGRRGGALASTGAFALDIERPEGWCAVAHVDPQPGLMLVFPGWAEHCVLPSSAGPRISYAFNFGEGPCAEDM